VQKLYNVTVWTVSEDDPNKIRTIYVENQVVTATSQDSVKIQIALGKLPDEVDCDRLRWSIVPIQTTESY
jgi:hypothetical protein